MRAVSGVPGAALEAPGSSEPGASGSTLVLHSATSWPAKSVLAAPGASMRRRQLRATTCFSVFTVFPRVCDELVESNPCEPWFLLLGNSLAALGAVHLQKLLRRTGALQVLKICVWKRCKKLVSECLCLLFSLYACIPFSVSKEPPLPLHSVTHNC